jgi:type II secretory pathway component PulM
MGGFEAGAVMGAAQAAWNRLEQRLDHEFDDLGRQLQSMASLIEQAVTTAEAAEAAASRPVVTGEQLRRAATSVKDSALGAGRARRERRGGPRSLGPGDGAAPSAGG